MPPRSLFVDRVWALHDFQAEEPDEMSLQRGDEILVLEKDESYGDGWWKGKTARGIGLFPANFTASSNPLRTSSGNANNPQPQPPPTLPKPGKSLAGQPTVVRNSRWHPNDELEIVQEFQQRLRMASAKQPPHPPPHLEEQRQDFHSSQDEQEFDENFLNRPPETWTVAETTSWLDQIGYGKFCQAFVENDINGKILMSPFLDTATLKELNVNTLERRITLLHEIMQLRKRCEEIDHDEEDQDDSRELEISHPFEDSYASVQQPIPVPTVARSKTTEPDTPTSRSLPTLLPHTSPPISNPHLAPASPFSSARAFPRFHSDASAHAARTPSAKTTRLPLFFGNTSSRNPNVGKTVKVNQNIRSLAAVMSLERIDTSSSSSGSINTCGSWNCDFAGYLYKQGGRAHWSWKRRYFVLKNMTLWYFKRHQETAKPLGVITLPSYRIYLDEDFDAENGVFSFIAAHPDARTYRFRAQTEEDMKRWISALSKACEGLPVTSVDDIVTMPPFLTGELPPTSTTVVATIPPTCVETALSVSPSALSGQLDLNRMTSSRQSSRPATTVETFAVPNVPPKPGFLRSVTAASASKENEPSAANKPFSYLGAGIQSLPRLKPSMTSVPAQPSLHSKVSSGYLSESSETSEEERETSVSSISFTSKLKKFESATLTQPPQIPPPPIPSKPTAQVSEEPTKFPSVVASDDDDDIIGEFRGDAWKRFQRQGARRLAITKHGIKRASSRQSIDPSLPALLGNPVERSAEAYTAWINSVLFSVDMIRVFEQVEVPLPPPPAHIKPISKLSVDIADGVVLIEFLLRLVAKRITEEALLSFSAERTEQSSDSSSFTRTPFFASFDMEYQPSVKQLAAITNAIAILFRHYRYLYIPKAAYRVQKLENLNIFWLILRDELVPTQSYCWKKWASYEGLASIHEPTIPIVRSYETVARLDKHGIVPVHVFLGDMPKVLTLLREIERVFPMDE